MTRTRALGVVAAAGALLLGTTLVVLGASSVAAAGQPGGGPRSGMNRPGRGLAGGLAGRLMARQLGLSDEQRTRIRSVAQTHRDELSSVRQRLRAARQGLRAASTAVPPDEAMVRQRSSELAAVQADAAVLRARVRSEMLQVLTPDQQAQLKTLQDRARSRRRNR